MLSGPRRAPHPAAGCCTVCVGVWIHEGVTHIYSVNSTALPHKASYTCIICGITSGEVNMMSACAITAFDGVLPGAHIHFIT